MKYYVLLCDRGSDYGEEAIVEAIGGRDIPGNMGGDEHVYFYPEDLFRYAKKHGWDFVSPYINRRTPDQNFFLVEVEL